MTWRARQIAASWRAWLVPAYLVIVATLTFVAVLAGWRV